MSLSPAINYTSWRPVMPPPLCGKKRSGKAGEFRLLEILKVLPDRERTVRLFIGVANLNTDPYLGNQGCIYRAGGSDPAGQE